MAQEELPQAISRSTHPDVDSGQSTGQPTTERVAGRNLPRLVEIFKNMLIESGFKEYNTETFPPEELEGNEFYLDVIDIPYVEKNPHLEQCGYLREWVFLFSRGSAAFNSSGLLESIE